MSYNHNTGSPYSTPANMARTPGLNKYLAEQLSILERSFAHLGDDKAKEALHDFRVSLRRIRSIFSSASKPPPKNGRRMLKRITQATNPIRDAEIFEQWVLKRKSLLKRFHDDSSLMHFLSSFPDASLLRQSFARRNASLVKQAANDIRKVSRELLPAATHETKATLRERRIRARRIITLRRHFSSHTQVKQAHKLRIAVKKLRYLLESSENSLDRHICRCLKQMQSTLGALHDLSVIRDILKKNQTVSRRFPTMRRRLLQALVDESFRIFGNFQARWTYAAVCSLLRDLRIPESLNHQAE